MLRNALTAVAICLALSEAVAGDPAQDEINKNLVELMKRYQETLGDHKKQLGEHGKRLTDQDKRLDDHANKSREQDRQLAELREWMNRSDQRMNDLERRQPFESPDPRRPSNSASGDEPSGLLGGASGLVDCMEEAARLDSAGMNTTSRSLMERLRHRPDDDAWKRFVDLYTPLLSGWMRSQGLPPADIDDLTQDVMQVLVRELPRFQHAQRPGAFRAWLRVITANRLRAYWRGRQHRPLVMGNSDFDRVLDQLEDPGSGLSRLWDEEHDSYVAHRLLEVVKPEFTAATWQAFERVVMNDEKPATVAKALAMTVNAVWIAKSRVLRRLRREMQGVVE